MRKSWSMAIELTQLKQLAGRIATQLTAAFTAAPARAKRVTKASALQAAVADIEVLFAELRNNPNMWRGDDLGTIDKLEQQYGRALGRLIAALGGLPLGTQARASSLARLILDDAAMRAELARVVAEGDADAELLESLYELFVATPRTSRAAPAPAPARQANTGPRAAQAQRTDAEAAAEHAAILVAERAAFVIPALLPRDAPPPEPAAPDPDLEPEHHVDRVHRVEPIDKTRKR